MVLNRVRLKQTQAYRFLPGVARCQNVGRCSATGDFARGGDWSFRNAVSIISGMPPSLPLAVATRVFGQPLRVALRRAAECGANGVQFELRDELRSEALTGTGKRQFLHSLTEYGLKIAPAHFPTKRALYATEQLDARIAAVRDAMTFASQLKTQVLTLRLGPLPAEADEKEAKTLIEVLNDLARHGNHVGVTLAIAPSGEPAAAYAKLLAQVTTGPIGIDFDPSSFVCAGRKVSEAFRELYTLVVHVQARDGVRDLDGLGAETAVGQGQVNWAELLALLYESGYRGWVTAVRNQGPDRGGDVIRAIETLKSIFL